ncbi:hypothetical protein L7F22_039379 [Adiantum nelumboides]|nr:hypothetical protein [Adiantum nelumboides]
MTSVLRSGAQNFRDLFRWKVKTTHYDENGDEVVTWSKPSMPPNPIRLLCMLNAIGWGAYSIGFLAWTADAFDFHALSIQTLKLSNHFGVSKTKVTEAITLTLLLRSVGAAVFGVFSDYFGRKYPLVLNMWLLGALQVGSIYCRNFNEFLAVRALFGLCMGGVYGGAAGMALENIPAEARGLFSGIFQQGYSFGYVLAACVNLGVGGATNTWTTMFWVGAGLSFLSGFLRLIFPESKQFIQARKEAGRGSGLQNFRNNFWKMLKKEWKVCVYAIILMSWFNWFSHSSQDSYTTFMLVGKGLKSDAASRASILMKTGACVGGTIWGYLSQAIGRRRAMILACLLCCCLIPSWVLPTSESGLEAGGFMLQSMVQGAWGVVPVYLSEISPPAFRAMFVGLTYQLGLAITASLGPEKKGINFENAAPATATEESNVSSYQNNKPQNEGSDIERATVDEEDEDEKKTEFETFAKGDNFHRRLSDLLGEHGIFVVDGEPWKRQRKMASHIFSVGNFRTCVQQTIDSDLLKMEKLLTNVAKEKVSINLPDLFFRFTLSSFSQLAFSADVECLPETVEGLSIRNSFADAFDSLNWLQMKDSLQFSLYGRDTTAQSLSWFFLEMATHSEIIEKIREEIQDSFGDRLNESHLTYDDMKQLPYLHAAFYEAIRLHPAVPKNIKQATQDTIIRPYATNDIDAKRDLPGGGTTERLPDITIKKGESVIWSDYVMARMPEIWGKDCEEYKPERFLETRDGKTSVRQFPQAIFHAFNGGPRVCLGQTLATYEGMAVIIAILTNFDIIYDYEKLKSDQPTFAESLTHPIQNPYSVRIQRRNHH